MDGPTTRHGAAPGGRVTAREVMTREYVAVSESDSVAGTADLLCSEDSTTAVVLYGSDPVGVVTAADALDHLNGGSSGEDPVGQVMSETPPTVSPETGVVAVAGEMADGDADCVLVVDDDEVVGLVTGRDVVGATASFAARSGVEGGSEAAPVDRETPEEAAGPPADEYATESNGDDYSNQGVCEICGSFTPELQNFNGQLVCSDCRGV